MKTMDVRSDAALSLAAAAGVAVGACPGPELVETFDEKAEWPMLQAVEIDIRSLPLGELVLGTVTRLAGEFRAALDPVTFQKSSKRLVIDGEDFFPPLV